MATQYDMVIRGGLIVDGSGNPPYTGDVAISGDKIMVVGDGDYSAETVLDAAGCVVTPGFVDIHTHYDGQAIWSDRLSPSSSHGVTTVVMGNCGVGFAPCRPQDHDLLIRVMEGVEDIPGVVMAEGLAWDWESFPDYMNALESRPRDIDVAVLFPHSPLRVYVMGERGAGREPATSEDLKRMYDLTSEALDAGAIGFATSRLLWHRTKAGEQIPSYDAATQELITIASALKDKGKGIIQMVLDAPNRSWTEEIDHLLEAVKSSGRPATFTVGTANRGPRVWQDAIDAAERANAAGAAIYPQVLPRPIGLIMGHDLSTNPFIICPTYRKFDGLTFEEKIDQLRDPAIRAALLAEAPEEGNIFAASARNWDWMFPLGNVPDYDPPLETSIGAQARATGRPPEEIAYDALLEQNGRAMLYNTLGNFHDGRLDAIYDMMMHRDVVVGLGDGGAHYGAICDASYPTFMLTYWIRDRDGPRLSLPQMVRMLSARPAEIMGLRDRGQIAAGFKADLNIIDLDRLQLHAPYVRRDLPGGGQRLDQDASGYVATICSGKIIRRDDCATEALPGRVVRGEQHVRQPQPA